MKRLKYLLKVLKDDRIWSPLLFWIILIGTEMAGIWTRTDLVWTANVFLLVSMGLVTWVFTGGITDHSFDQEETWVQEWNKGNSLAVSIVFLGRFIFSGIIAGSIINPF